MKARTFFVKKLQPKNFQEEEKLSSLSLLSLPDFSFCAAFSLSPTNVVKV